MLTAAATGARGTGRVVATTVTPDHEILRRGGPEVTAWSALPADELVNGLFRDHAVNLVRIATLLLGDQPSAEDVVQDAFLQLYRSLPRLGVSRGTVSSTLSRGLAALARELKEDL
jgi:hypothetical protein